MIDIQYNQHPNKHWYQILHIYVRSSQNVSMIRISIDWIAMHLIGLQCICNRLDCNAFDWIAMQSQIIWLQCIWLLSKNWNTQTAFTIRPPSPSSPPWLDCNAIPNDWIAMQSQIIGLQCIWLLFKNRNTQTAFTIKLPSPSSPPWWFHSNPLFTHALLFRNLKYLGLNTKSGLYYLSIFFNIRMFWI